MSELEVVDELRGFGFVIPFVKELGFILKSFEGGHSSIDYAARAEHLNSFGVVHGGAVMTLLDVSMATAARSVDKQSGIITIEMKTTFMRPCKGQLHALGELLHRTRATAFVQARVLDEAGDLCAHATGTFRYVPREKSAGHASETIGTDASSKSTSRQYFSGSVLPTD
jgi:uncharacterized protein (TIGR00369 family)